MLTRVPAKFVTPAAVKAMLSDGKEVALIDVREELIYSQSHLLWARCVPLSRLELKFARLVPRKGTRIVLVDDNDGLAARAAAVLAENGYSEVAILDGGNDAWAAAGYELFSGVYVPSKAFGEFIEHDCDTPNISADELAALIRDRADMVILDSRPLDEFSRVSIPTATNVPGAELVLRARDMAPSPDTLVVVNCAGRTRSIIGAQSLINAGLPNKVVALRNGTMGFTLAGHSCDSGKTRQAPPPSTDALAWAQSAAAEVAKRHGVIRIDAAALARFRDESEERTLYLFDVRDPPEYAAGHVAGAVSAPGGQLVQATDQYVGTLGARIVLVDDLEVRAVMTGSWLRQMGFRDVFVLVEKGSEREVPPAPILAAEPAADQRIDATQLAELLARNEATVVDLSPSREYLKGHIPGAWFAIRARLAHALGKIAPSGTLVLTSEDGVLAGIAAAEAAALTGVPVRFLAGGNGAWQAAGQRLSTEPRMADEPVDTWLKPYERANNVREAMNEYLRWEVDLLPSIARDGTADFAQFKP
ncbi:MAG: rhodanese-like domain-containing protein [Xanthobacteraceae bacterium]